MHHYCAICKSPFMTDSGNAAEVVATACGHVFHRDCAERHILLKEPRCFLCGKPTSASALHKVFFSYEEGEYDHELSAIVQSGTNWMAPNAPLPVDGLQREISALREEHAFNQEEISRLDKQWASAQGLAELYNDRLARLDRLTEETNKQYVRAKEALAKKASEQGEAGEA
ncbi:hypothetical protein OH76DRAFT_1394600 [Lentinus brumalis]|uniref:RING-type domain-containing protein n=1 Tax=Lentinus brumalis TaxID=2498619 RepID=A0A371CH31_9APHY|nr:hypothetical protein OH76DRAFT_1394600 [Polyporus brumalis]